MPKTKRGLHYEVTDLRPAWRRGKDSGRPVVFHHGVGTSLEIFDEWMPIIADAPSRGALRHARLRPVGRAAGEPRLEHGGADRGCAGGCRGGVRQGAGARDGQVDRRHDRARRRAGAAVALRLGRHEQCGHQGRPDRPCAGLAGGDRAHRHQGLERPADGDAVRAEHGPAGGAGVVCERAGEIAGACRHWIGRAARRHRPRRPSSRASSCRCC